MTGSQYGNVSGQPAKRGPPGKTLERRKIEIGRSAISTPSTHRQQTLHAGLVDRLCDLDCIGPVEPPRLWHRRDGRTMAAIERHDAELHAIAAEQAGAGRHIARGRSELHCRLTCSLA